MRIEKIYIADDGARFQTEWDCIEYEDKLKAEQFKETAFLLDENGEVLPLTEWGFQNATFIKCKTAEAAKYLHKQFGDWENPWGHDNESYKADCWIYINDEWKVAADVLAAMEVLKKVIDM